MDEQVKVMAKVMVVLLLGYVVVGFAVISVFCCFE